MPSYCLDWYAGASAQLELLRQAQGGFQARYVSPFRPTIRIPMEEGAISEGDLQPTNDELNQFVADADARAGGQAVRAGVAIDLAFMGRSLFELVVPRYVQSDLRVKELFVEFGVDERLVKYPWELMHDGEDYLCLKHFFGRFVNVERPRTVPNGRGTNWIGTPVKDLTVLIVSVPNPLPRDGIVYPALPGVQDETMKLAQMLTAIPGVRVETLVGPAATFKNVFTRLTAAGAYHILHFNGHASTEGLMLHDQNMTTRQLERFVTKNSPILCFVNACESGQTQQWQSRYDIFDVARAFLETGAYLLGSRWKIADRAAATFAPAFYSAFIGEGKPLGRAVQEARVACRKAHPDSFAWASYVFYGDPRVHFRIG